MWIPLALLAVLSVVGGFVGVPAALGGSNHFEHFLEPVVAHVSTTNNSPNLEAVTGHEPPHPQIETGTVRLAIIAIRLQLRHTLGLLMPLTTMMSVPNASSRSSQFCSGSLVLALGRRFG
jgi:NADH-quinone oxidoreductase subunit L